MWDNPTHSVSSYGKEQFDFKLIRRNDKPIIVLNWVDLKTLLVVLAVLGLNLNSAVDCVYPFEQIYSGP